MTGTKSPVDILMDVETELQGYMIEDTFKIFNHDYTLRLLSEEETIWTFGFLDPKSPISIAVASRLANLAVGLRAIDGCPVNELFQSVYDALTPEQREVLTAENEDFAVAKIVKDWLEKQPGSLIDALHGHWQELEERRREAQGEVGNSSGEDSEKEEKKNSTESSQPGEESQTDSE